MPTASEPRFNLKCPECLYSWEHAPSCSKSPAQSIRNVLILELIDKVIGQPALTNNIIYGEMLPKDTIIGLLSDMIRR